MRKTEKTKIKAYTEALEWIAKKMLGHWLEYYPSITVFGANVMASIQKQNPDNPYELIEHKAKVFWYKDTPVIPL